ncbi:MAG: ribonuclease P protein component [Chloroflexi bacterium]|nr:ribonuclease P protein component [Chloroflexota bacterium]
MTARLRTTAEFERVRARGHQIRTRYVSVQCERTGAGLARVGLVVGRRVGGAVQRNRVRRRLREIIRLSSGLPAGCDCVITARSPAALAAYADLQSCLITALRAASNSLGSPSGGPGAE